MERKKAVRVLEALSSRPRLAVYSLLMKADIGGLSAGDIARSLDVASSSLSFHLKELMMAGVVICEQRGRQTFYSPNVQAIRDLIGFLTESCCAEEASVLGSGSSMSE
ncbi:ArsR/SmtB family transcription factor [Burkholderia oklahomensis]|uniref:ArsR/SmtB family transcription factor n=1 Tax=Burkholderia oklahomensis TaxID=342113 RepID=UPI00016A803C|nr:helix-turn-helix transcriptional regulator [Burkholderia oklahomensis]AOI47144.1 hypothetical protein WI23_15915 [Burkholderia oklahomensis C6786]KUY47563.1 hypothetical protein WI23_29125 [Burkholderia oklahomensis C6786]MBI0360176.1 helix-turn-helix transcriptional regulator [Burkholderia oklahomensis]